ncbi:MAG: family 43 glycosylhydrolase [Massilia sp.]
MGSLRYVASSALLAALAASAWAAPAATYRNPLPVHLANGEPAQNCADPAVLRDPRAKTPTWYLYCTSDPVSKNERPLDGEKGDWHFHMIAIYRSTDLVGWSYVGDAFADRPAGLAAPTSGLWAPEPEFLNGHYYLYFTVTDVVDAHSPEAGCDKDSAIGVAIAESPAGPWVPASAPVVPPRRAGSGCDFQWTFDPKVVEDGGRKWIYYGSYGGGVYVQPLRPDGLRAEGSPRKVGAAWRYEGAEVVRHGGWWYLFGSTTDCCNGPLTGYAVYAGRARTPAGPFLDRLGQDLAAPRAGGTPVLFQNGNRWVGVGHNTVFPDAGGQWWTIYHGIDVNEPFFSARDKLTRRLALLDRIDWVDGWPIARGAPSDEPRPAPATATGTHPRALALAPAPAERASALWTDTFGGPELDERWSWLRAPAGDAWSAGRQGLRLATAATDLHVDTNTASVLQAALPDGDYRIEAEVTLDVPDGCCKTAVQAGVVVMRDDDNYVKLVEMAHGGLRQVEFAKELSPVPDAYPRYGNTVAGTPGTTTWLRLDVHRGGGDERGVDERYSGYSSRDGKTWVGGGTWTHRLGPQARLGLVAMGGAGYRAVFRRVSVERLSR